MTQSITKNHHFKYLYARGKQSVSPFFALYTRPNRPFEGENQLYLGITVGVKLGNAVTRNKVRRRIRAIYRLHEAQLKPGFHLVIVARNRCATATYAQMEESFCKLCDQVELSQHPKHKPRYQIGKSAPKPKPTNQGKKLQNQKNPQHSNKAKKPSENLEKSP